MSIKKSTLASVFIFVTFITTSVAQSSTTYDQCAPFYYCGDDPVFRKPQLSRFNFIHAHSTLSSSRKIDFFFFFEKLCRCDYGDKIRCGILNLDCSSGVAVEKT